MDVDRWNVVGVDDVTLVQDGCITRFSSAVSR